MFVFISDFDFFKKTETAVIYDYIKGYEGKRGLKKS